MGIPTAFYRDINLIINRLRLLFQIGIFSDIMAIKKPPKNRRLKKFKVLSYYLLLSTYYLSIVSEIAQGIFVVAPVVAHFYDKL
jgi:hypothetical protein